MFVLNLNHNKDEVKSIKDFQIQTLFPLLKNQLAGSEKSLLDFGCGSGRFSVELADLINGKVTAVDPIAHLLKLAPESKNVEYIKIYNSHIPIQNECFDIIWICLVLGGIVAKKELTKTIKELQRVSKKGTLLFLIENTSPQKNVISWHYRTIQEYMDLFKDFSLKHLQDYEDMGERISIFAGRSTKDADSKFLV